ncbi:unnamed protein product, partial [Rotaria sp. Silwood2]
MFLSNEDPLIKINLTNTLNTLNLDKQSIIYYIYSINLLYQSALEPARTIPEFHRLK